MGKKEYIPLNDGTVTDPENVFNIKIGNKVDIGDGCLFNNTAPITIGNRVTIGDHVSFITGKGNNIAPIEIGDGCCIGSDVMILPGSSIPKNSVVRSNSVVN